MKTSTKILFVIIIVSLILFSGAYIFLMLEGAPIIAKKLQDLTHRQVNIGSFELKPPLNLEIKNLDIQGLAKIESIFISPSIPYLLTGNIALNRVRVLKPEFFFEKKSGEPSAPANTAGSGGAASPGQNSQQITGRLRLILKRLNIKGGRINFIDHTVGKEGIRIALKDIDLNLANLYAFPASAVTKFEFKGRIPWQQGHEEGKIALEGWMNFSKKDMQATLKITDIDGVYLYPYYSQWVDLEKARIERANLNFTSNIRGLDNNVTADCHLELTDIVRKPRSPEEPQEKAEKIADAVMDIFRAVDQGKIVLNFTIRTKMNRPEFGFGNIKMAFEDKLSQARGSGFKMQDILTLPRKLLDGAAKGANDFSKAVINGTFAVGKEFKKAVEEALERVKKGKKRNNKVDA